MIIASLNKSFSDRADARMEQIARFESRCAYERRKFEDTYLEMLKAKYDQCDDDDAEWERLAHEQSERRQRHKKIDHGIF